MCGIQITFRPKSDCVKSFPRQLTDPSTREISKLTTVQPCDCFRGSLSLSRRGPDRCGTAVRTLAFGSLTFQNSQLQLRGAARSDWSIPVSDLVDGDLLAYNGEIYSFTETMIVGSDTLWLWNQLRQAKGMPTAICQTLSLLRGPWCAVYWHHETQTLWIGKDIFGRRSLLLHPPDATSGAFCIASVTPGRKHRCLSWLEIPPGIHSITWDVDRNAQVNMLFSHHAWGDAVPLKIFHFRRRKMTSNCKRLGNLEATLVTSSKTQRVWGCLDYSMRVRTIRPTQLECTAEILIHTTFGILFSGGLDSVLLCALLHRHIPSEEAVDLYNVCFAGGKSRDRLSALSAVNELSSVTPGRRWRLVEINIDKHELKAMEQYIQTLIHPNCSLMDFNIGAALWFAARGVGKINSTRGDNMNTAYHSRSRVIFSGQGADELFGGYSRHRSALSSLGVEALTRALRVDLLRLWRRNLGRDDRICSDHGREFRYPYLDEALVCEVLDVPTSSIHELTKICGDKSYLRNLARHLGLQCTAKKRKIAIQFGSNIAAQHP